MYEQPQHDAELHAAKDEEGRRGLPALIILGIVIVVAIVFIAQNSDKATIQFLFIEVTTRIWAGFLIAIALGVVLDRLFSMWWRRRKQREQ
jgi:uncharacterized integral membrane protein